MIREMVCSGLKGQRILSDIYIDFEVLREPGVYILYKTKTGPPRYVGRSDGSLYERLKQHLNEPYKYYRFKQCTTKKDAFEWECKYWHKFQDSIDNSEVNWGNHPARPKNTSYYCPVKGCWHN